MPEKIKKYPDKALKCYYEKDSKFSLIYISLASLDQFMRRTSQ